MSHTGKPRTTNLPTNGDSRQAPVAAPSRTGEAFRYVFAITRISLGWIFVWAFLDKTFALGFSTGVDPQTGAVDRFGDAAWINGGSPIEGFLTNSTKGPFADIYRSIADDTWAEWLFMLGLLGIGLTLMLGIGLRVGAACGALLMLLMWAAVLPPTANPFMDDHIIYGLLMVSFALFDAGDTLGLGGWWKKRPLVVEHPWLK